MRIVISIEKQEYKEKPYWQAAVECRASDRAGRFSWNRSHDSEEQARDWAIDKVEHLLVPGVQDPDSISIAHEARDIDKPCPDPACSRFLGHGGDHWSNQCRCCGTPMQGSDHCPECGCEEYEEVCPKTQM